tara:strand:+ start:325 stop:684 length:360 start_codon:yes stop_codon:yes gene_type:complete
VIEMSWQDIIKGEDSLISKKRTPKQAVAMKFIKRIISEVETPKMEFEEQMKNTIKDIRDDIIESGIATYNLRMRMLLDGLERLSPKYDEENISKILDLLEREYPKYADDDYKAGYSESD